MKGEKRWKKAARPGLSHARPTIWEESSQAGPLNLQILEITQYNNISLTL